MKIGYACSVFLICVSVWLYSSAIVVADEIILLGPDTSSYPTVTTVVRMKDARGRTVRNIENAFTIQEEVTNQIRNDIRPEVAYLSGGQRIAFTLILETRNQTTREDLNAARDFFRHFVETMPHDSPGPLFEDADQIQLWVPGKQDAVVVPFESQGFQKITLINAINQVLPYSGDSTSLQSLISQIAIQPLAIPGPHIVILAGRFSNIGSSSDALALTSLANLNNISFYAVPINSDPISIEFLKLLSVSTGGRLLDSAPINAELLRDEVFQLYKGQYILRYTSAFTPSASGHRIEVRADTSMGNIRQDIGFTPSTIHVPEPITRAQGILAILLLLLLFGVLLIAIAAGGIGIRVRRSQMGNI